MLVAPTFKLPEEPDFLGMLEPPPFLRTLSDETKLPNGDNGGVKIQDEEQAEESEVTEVQAESE